jgi:hypothetical protein
VTAIVSVLCKDGVVVGTDSSATFTDGTRPTIEQTTEKVLLLRSHVILAGTGYIGHNQRFAELIEKSWDERVFLTKHPMDVARHLSKGITDDLRSTNAMRGDYGAVVAYPCRDRFCLCEFEPKALQPELKNEKIWYCSMGSAQQITDPFLALMREVFWNDGPPNTQEGIFVVTWALDHAVKVNPGGVNAPIRIAVLLTGKKGPEPSLLTEEELSSHRQNVEEAKIHLRDYAKKFRPEAAPDLPKP